MGECVTVIGAGSWGTALAKMLALNGMQVVLHCYPPEIAEGITRNLRNPLYFPEVELPSTVRATTDIAAALQASLTAYLVVPSRYLRAFMTNDLEAWQAWGPGRAVLCNCTKGLLLNPTERTDAWLATLLPDVQLCHLAGPNFAKELVRGLPAATVVAGPEKAAQRIQAQLMSDYFRIYTGAELIGVEVAGFYKNIIAIAAGAASELGLGHNARASLVTRALAEMGRLVAYFGGDPATLMGLAGIGDLMLTCSSELSRNFQVGMRRARAQSLDTILSEMVEVAEGIQACEAVHRWPTEHGLSGWPELPIAEEVYLVVHEGAEPRESLMRLMRRPPKAE